MSPQKKKRKKYKKINSKIGPVNLTLQQLCNPLLEVIVTLKKSLIEKNI